MKPFKLSVLGCVVATGAMALWLFAHWYSYAMADFDCAADAATACRRAAFYKSVPYVVLPLLLCCLWGFLLVRAWKRS